MRVSILYLLISSFICLKSSKSSVWDINLPRSHISYFFKNNQELRGECDKDELCPFQNLIHEDGCWGYELPKCEPEKRMKQPNCSGDSRFWAKSRSEQEKIFWEIADFGLVLGTRKELKVLCKPNSQDDSLLKCSSNIRYCEAKNIFIDLRYAKIKKSKESNRYREDLLGPGLIGGHCSLDVNGLKSEGNHKSPLQSWFAELEHYTSVDFYPSKGEKCDIVFDKPTYLIKLDAGVNMYHHFCDFVNLYVSQHVNNSFNTDVNIIMWDTSAMNYADFFKVTWKAFSDHPIIALKDLDGKRICIKDAVFPLLARQRAGLYYNMPLIPGCEGSSLFQAFSQHILHRLHIGQDGPLEEKIRITLLVRSTLYRNVLNQDELASTMKTVGEFEVTVVDYNWHMPFEDQLKITYNSDILISIHGSGLTHMLFQPNWAVVFELYNCEDPDCYHDLARLRGIKYMTWEKKEKLHQEDEGHHPTMGAHAKFTNYAFDVTEFMRLVNQAADHVRGHPEFIKAKQDKYGKKRNVNTERIEL